MSEHTKGRARVSLAPPTKAQGIDILIGDARFLCCVPLHPDYMGLEKLADHANARRLVACWNACERLSTEALEDGCEPALANAKIRGDLLSIERDELIEALRACVEVTKVWHGTEVFDIYYDCSPEMKPIREALAKHTQKEEK